MPKDGLGYKSWVLVCDGRKALLGENEGDSDAPNLAVRETFEHPDPPTHDLGTDEPGRVFAGTGERRSAIEPTDFHALAEEEFLRHVAAELNRYVSDGRIGSLILVAPPRALGTLRPLLSPATRKIIGHEFEKDYVRMPLYEVERHLVQQLKKVRAL